jgi:dTDP-4-amino-4,6-dideoxygalactose transaminase
MTYQEAGAPSESRTASRKTIRFLPLGGLFEEDDRRACDTVLAAACAEGGNFFPLPEENEFQTAFAAHEHARHAVAVNSCGTALDLCMMALNIGPGDEVIVPPLTFVCTATCAAARGAKVVFADIDEKTLCLNPSAVEAKITARTRAILPVHFAGLACDLEAFDVLSERYNVPVIYDAAHAVGARRHAGRVGGAGKASCYSFQSNKNITTLGEGGAVTTNDPDFAELVRQKKTFGYVYGSPLRVVTVGFNYRMTKPQLAVGLTQIRKAERIRRLRLERFCRMQELLRDVSELILPGGIGADHACHLYVVRLDTSRVRFTREDLRAELKSKHGVETVVHYPAVWTWEAFASLDYDATDCPYGARACEQVFSLPLFPSTSLEDVEYIHTALKASIRHLRS